MDGAKLSYHCVDGTLAHRMNVSVSTGATKSPRDVSLASMSLRSVQGETILLLTEFEVGKGDRAGVEKECESIVRHSLAETEGDPAQRLDGSLKELNGLFKGLLLSGALGDVHMVIGILDKTDMLHVSHAGRAEAYLIRRGLASQITEYQSGKPTPAFVHIASGQLEPRDTVIFATQRLLRTLTPAQLAQMAEREQLLESMARALEREAEHAALATFHIPSKERAVPQPAASGRPAAGRLPVRSQRAARLGSSARGAGMAAVAAAIPYVGRVLDAGMRAGKSVWSSAMGRDWSGIGDAFSGFLSDLTHPKRKRRAHLLLIAGAVGVLVVIYAVVGVFTFSQRSKTRGELAELVTQIDTDLQAAENQRLMGEIARANAILLNAENSAQKVLDDSSGLYRKDASDLLARIRAKREEINNVIRLSAPQVVADLSAKSGDIAAEGLIGLDDGEFLGYDRQDAYRILLNSVEDPVRISDDQLILDGNEFARFSTIVFLMTGNGLVEFTDGQATTMKTDDPNGWVSGKDMETYQRFLYILSPEQKQIYKYERLNGRYGAPSQYNVNGDLTGALDMAIDGDVYVLKDGGTIVKLFRGENQHFEVRKAPDGLLADATKLVKVPGKSFYVLDATNNRVIVLGDGAATGDAPYLKQYVFDGEQVGTLKDLYVDGEETRLYVMDEKRIYVVDLSAH
jgi:hypothetical protein